MSIAQISLDCVFHFLNGKSPRPSSDGEFPIYGSNGKIGFSKEHNHERSIVIGRVGAYCGSVEVCESKFWGSDNTIILKPKDGHNLKYWFYRLKSYPLGNYSGGAAQPLLTQKTLKPIKINSHQIESEQFRIAEILSTYDDLIDNSTKRIGLLEKSACLLFREWFIRLQYPGHENANVKDGIPEGWTHGNVNDFYETASGGTPSRKNPDYFTGDINWVKTQELLDGYIFETDEKITEQAISESSAKIFPENTVLVAMYGATIGRLGILAKPSSTNQACCALITKHKDSNPFFAYLFLAENKQGLINLAQGAAQNNISQQVIRNYPMVLPAKNIMDAFVERVEPIFKLKQSLELQIKNLATARDLLLPRLMNGDITV
ncbi:MULTISPECIES: restriction endonuclease subunit S [Aeromonas]|uniref:Restriction endonuclease subunit S n=1 Tax=Aeromonas simiae TaxID=218936 RepID=A0A5J6WZF4_9GAMM|nr:restriction endonuclease subunit S [Aeromonas simiae]QFI55704.1 restriction endonuclease subunit S [Aeromonas simiae]